MNWNRHNRHAHQPSQQSAHPHPVRLLMAKLIVCGALASLSGCAGLVYDNLRDESRNQCNKLVNPEERAACIKRYQQSYEAYEKERIKLLQSK